MSVFETFYKHFPIFGSQVQAPILTIYTSKMGS